MAVSSFKDYNKAYLKKIAEIESLANSYVLIGIQEGTVTKSATKGKEKKVGGLSMAEIGAANEFGSKNVPARPFLRPAIDENRSRINRAIAGEYDKILEGNSTVKKSLNLLGLFGVDLVQKKIRSIHFPPNAPSTIKRKGSSKPLIDFGQMIQSIRHKVVIS